MRNLGDRAGDCVVQLYAGPAEPGVDDAIKKLCAFTKVAVEAGGEVRATLTFETSELAHFDPAARHWTLSTSAWRLYVGQHSADPKALRAELALPMRSWTVKER